VTKIPIETTKGYEPGLKSTSPPVEHSLCQKKKKRDNPMSIFNVLGGGEGVFFFFLKDGGSYC
jgi:hypothetical protein